MHMLSVFFAHMVNAKAWQTSTMTSIIWMLRQSYRDVGIEHVGFSVQRRAEESHPSPANTLFVAQQSPSLVTDAL